LLFMSPLFLLPTLFIGKQPALWRQTEIGSGAVRSLAIASGDAGPIIYAATAQRGLLMHQNSRGWQSASQQGMPLSSLGRLAIQIVRVAPWDSRALFAARRSENGEVYRSTDAGETWSPSLVDRHSPVRDIALSAHGDRTLFVATSTHLYRSTDAGAHWVAVPSPPSEEEILALAVSSRDPARLYVGLAGGQLFRSDVGGTHWVRINAGLGRLSVRALAVDREREQRAYVGTSTGVHGTDDGGLSWQRLGSETTTGAVRSLLIDPVDPAIIFVGTEKNGVFWSADRGTRWTKLAPGMGPLTVYALALDPVTHNRLYAGTSVGLWSLDISFVRAATVSGPLHSPTVGPVPSPTRTAAPTTALPASATPAPAAPSATTAPTTRANTPSPTPTSTRLPTVSPSATRMPAVSATATVVPTLPPTASPAPPTAEREEKPKQEKELPPSR